MIHDDQVEKPSRSLNEEGLTSVQTQHTSTTVQNPVTKHMIPSGFSPSGVRKLLRKVSRAVEIDAVKKKRKYQFHVRVPKPAQSPPLRRKIRSQRAPRRKPFSAMEKRITLLRPIQMLLEVVSALLVREIHKGKRHEQAPC